MNGIKTSHAVKQSKLNAHCDAHVKVCALWLFSINAHHWQQCWPSGGNVICPFYPRATSIQMVSSWLATYVDVVCLSVRLFGCPPHITTKCQCIAPFQYKVFRAICRPIIKARRSRQYLIFIGNSYAGKTPSLNQNSPRWALVYATISLVPEA